MFGLFSTIGNTIGTTLLSFFIEQIAERIKDKKIIDQIQHEISLCILTWERKFTGSIIDSDVFFLYFENHNMIDDFISYYTATAAVRCGKKQFVDQKIKDCIQYINKNHALSVNDKGLIADLLYSIWNILEKNFCNHLSLNEKILRTEITSSITERIDISDQHFNQRMDIHDSLLRDIHSAVTQSSTEPNHFFSGVIEQPNGLRYEISLDSEDSENPFIAETWVKANDGINRFGNIQTYINYKTWAGEDIHFEVVKNIIKRNNIIFVDAEIEPAFEGPTYQLPTFFAEGFKADHIPQKEKQFFAEMFLHITVPRDQMEFDIETEKHEVLVDNCKLEITRKVTGDKLSVKTHDTRTDSKIKVSYSVEFQNNLMASAAFSLAPNNSESALSMLSFKRLECKIKSSEEIVFRNRKDQRIMIKVRVCTSKEELDICNNEIQMFEKIVYIQDHFGIVFNLPEKIDKYTQIIINDAYSLLKDGITYSCPYTVTMTTEEIASDPSYEVGQKMLLTSNYENIILFDNELPFEKITSIFPNTICTEIKNNQQIFNAQQPCIFIWDSKYGPYDVLDLAQNEMKKWHKSNKS